MIDAATLRIENEISLKCIEQVLDIYFDNFPYSNGSEWWDGVRDGSIKELIGQAKNVVLPIGKGKQFIGFSTFSDDQEFTHTPSDFIFDNAGNRTRVGLKIGGVWPQTVLRASNGARFRIKVGFGATGSSVPSDIKMAILELVAHMYENRGDQNEMVIPPHVITLIAPYKRMKIENC